MGYDTLIRKPCAFIKGGRVLEEEGGRFWRFDDSPLLEMKRGSYMQNRRMEKGGDDGRTSMRRRRSRRNLRER